MKTLEKVTPQRAPQCSLPNSRLCSILAPNALVCFHVVRFCHLYATNVRHPRSYFSSLALSLSQSYQWKGSTWLVIHDVKRIVGHTNHSTMTIALGSPDFQICACDIHLYDSAAGFAFKFSGCKEGFVLEGGTGSTRRRHQEL